MHPLEQWRAEESERRQRPFRKRDAAKELGFSPSRYTQLVKHGQSPSSALAKRIKAQTGISIDELMDPCETGAT